MVRRTVKRRVRGQRAIDGAGVHLIRILGTNTITDFDPFLMLDGFDSTNPIEYIKGFPWHPHRGIETVTYLLKGEVEHGDSLGNRGMIGNNQCQWMTAGSGIIHQEMPQISDRLLGCQLWVNLPGKDKMTEPAYRDITAEDIVVIREGRATVKILSGNYKDRQGPMKNNYVNVQYLDITLEPDTEWRYRETPNDHTLFLYVIEGSLATDEALEMLEDRAFAILFSSLSTENDTNDEVWVKSGAEGARFFLLAAKPLKEPVAWGGPVVMNTREELNEAYKELDNGSFIKHGKPQQP